MTGPAAISSSAAAPAIGAKAKPADAPSEDATRSDLSEFAAFAELFASMEGEDAVSSDAASDDKDAQSTDADAVPPPVLLAEMMHHRWFGGSVGVKDAAAEPPMRLAPVLAIMVARGPMTGADLATATEDLPQSPQVGTAVDAPAAPPKLTDDRLQSLSASIAAQALTQNSALPPQNPPPAGDNPAPIEPEAPAVVIDRPAAALVDKIQVAAPASATPDTRPRAAVPTDVKASLLALETVLAKGGAATGQDAMADGNARQFGAALGKEAHITSVQQQTHFAPAIMPSIIPQITDRIQEEMRSLAPQSLRELSNQPGPDTAPIRVLSIQLDPPQLGPLTIRLSLKNDTLSLQLETPRHETAALIQRDSDLLSGVLRSAGYVMDGLNIQVSAPDRGLGAPLLGGGAAAGFGQAMGQQQGGRQSDGRGAGRVTSGGRQEETSGGNVNERLGTQPVKPRGGPIYI